MLGLSLGEILAIAAVALLVVGPDRLPEVLRFLGKQYGQLRRATEELRGAFVLGIDPTDPREERHRAQVAARREHFERQRQRAEERRRLAELPDVHAEAHPPPSEALRTHEARIEA